MQYDGPVGIINRSIYIFGSGLSHIAIGEARGFYIRRDVISGPNDNYRPGCIIFEVRPRIFPCFLVYFDKMLWFQRKV